MKFSPSVCVAIIASLVSCLSVINNIESLQQATSKMIYHHGASLSEPVQACIADLMFCHGTLTAGLVTAVP